MSNALAIAAVTKSLVNLITNEIVADPQQDLPSGIHVTAQPPDAANSDTTNTNQINLFLYHIMPNAAWRNMPLPDRVSPGESAQPPLALNLYYLITAYTRETGEVGDIDGHNLLGRVMRVLYDHPVLSAKDITLPDSDVQNQIERIRITMQPLNIEEIYRLWTGFQTQYRLSVSYEVSVILIESTRAASKPLPVLQMGRDKKGAQVVSDPFPYPVLFSARVKNVAMPASPGSFGGADVAGIPPVVLPGDTLILQGHRLSGPTVQVIFTSLQGQSPPPITPASNSGDSIEIAIPQDTSGQWPYGYYMLTVKVELPPLPPPAPQFPPASTNAVVIALAPRIDTGAGKPTATRQANGDVIITLNTVQPVLNEQSVSLLLNDQEIIAAPRPTTQPSSTSFSFTWLASEVQNGTSVLRLRVDGVDSIPFDRPINPQQPWDPFKNPPSFDPNQQVTI